MKYLIDLRMQSRQRCDLLPGVPRAFHPASKHAVKVLARAESLEAAGNQVAARIDCLARRAAPVDGDGCFQVLEESSVELECPLVLVSHPESVVRLFRRSLILRHLSMLKAARRHKKPTKDHLWVTASNTRLFESFSVLNHPVH